MFPPRSQVSEAKVFFVQLVHGACLHVHTEYVSLAFADNRILVLCCHNRKSLLLASLNFDEPTPTTALDTEESCIEGVFEFVLIFPCGLNLFGKLWSSRDLGFRTVCWSEILPEKRVIDMSTSVKFDALLQSNLSCDIGCVYSFGLCLERGIQVRDICLMVLAVMQLHDLL